MYAVLPSPSPTQKERKEKSDESSDYICVLCTTYSPLKGGYARVLLVGREDSDSVICREDGGLIMQVGVGTGHCWSIVDICKL